MKWQAAAREQAKKHLASELGCPFTGEGLRIAAISECLRAASYLCSVPVEGSGAWEPAASLSLTSIVRKRLSPVWPSLMEDVVDDSSPGVMEVLDSLGRLGDLVRVAGGWLTPQPRAVRATSGSMILFGGGPSPTLPVGVSTKACGRVRVVSTTTCDGWVDACDPEEWIGAPVEGLSIWSSRLLTEAKARFTQPYDLKPVSVYLNGRWLDLASVSSAEGVHLAKCQTGKKTSYFIGAFFNGALQRMASIDSTDARRLRFQLDIQAGCSVRVEAERFSSFVKLRLYRRLPPEQEKTLLLGWELPRPEGEHPGLRIYVIPMEALPIVRHALDGLGIVWIERQGAQGSGT